MKSKIKQLGAGVVLSYFSQGIQIILTLFYTPIMLHLLGQSEYGLYQLVFSVVSYLSLFTFGFSSAYIKFYAIAKAKEDSDTELKKINGMFFVVFLVLGLLVLVLGIAMVFNIRGILGSHLTDEELEISKILMLILVINCFIHFITIVFQNYVIANEKFIWFQVINIVCIIVNPCLTFPLLLLGFKSIALASVLLVTTLVKFFGYVIYSVFKLRMCFTFKQLKYNVLKDVGKFSFYIFIESIVSTINLSIDRFLLGRMVGSVSVAIYSVGGQINTLYTTLSTSITFVFTPRINKLVTEGDRQDELSSMFISIGKVQFAILYLVLLGFTAFGHRFISIWAGSDYQTAYYIALMLIWPNTINLIQNIGIEIQRAIGLQKYRSYMYLAIASINIVISYLFIKKWGESGAALGTALAWIVGSGFFMNIFYAIRVNLDVIRFWKEIARMGGWAIILVLPFIKFSDYFFNCPIYIYILSILMFSIAYCFGMLFIGLRVKERKKIMELLHSKIPLKKM